MNHTATLPAAGNSWPKAALIAGLLLTAIFILYWPTFHSMLEIWERSETFAHGYLIFPISAWLIWRKRYHLTQIEPRPDWRGLVFLVLAGAGWLLADAGSVKVVAQYAFIALLIAAIWAVLGSRVVRAIFFPLAFLLFAVPVGEFLIAPLMEFTADFTVKALQLTGIPVYREGTFFSIPSGDWSVVEGCSGLRYLIASITLGVLYAYLTYRSWKKRLIFSISSLIVPVIANGFRAYMIVMIAHLSDMKLALGVDHFIYGWVWFGIVMLILFWIGSFWREDEEHLKYPVSSGEETERGQENPGRFILMAMAVLMLSMLSPLYSAWLNKHADLEVARIEVTTNGGWQLKDMPTTDWHPRWLGADQQIRGNYQLGGERVFMEVNYYRSQRQDRELINSQNVFIPQKHPLWSNVGEENKRVIVHGKALTVRQAKLRSFDQRLLAWQWNLIDGSMVTNDYVAKFKLALNKIIGNGDEGVAIIIATPYLNDLGPAEKTLSNFMASLQTEINRQ
ncbi:MAG: exosortase A [Hydrogenophilaceae bacterium]|nr:exosortase A [Hydrogenophilaceae bacterium]